MLVLGVTCSAFTGWGAKKDMLLQGSFEDSKLNIEIKETSGVETYELKCSDNRFFFNSKNVVSGKGNIEIPDIAGSVVYLKICPIKNGFAMLNSEKYIIKNHEHTYEKNEQLSVSPKCEEKGCLVEECTECDSVRREVLAELGCDMYIQESKKSSCSEEGYQLWCCRRCGKTKNEVFEKLEHKFEFAETVKKATCVSEGEEKYICVNCAEERIEKTEVASHSYVYNGDFADNSTVGVNSKCQYCGKTTSKKFAKQYVGTYEGVLHIPSLNVTVPVYFSTSDQAVVDALDSAALTYYGVVYGEQIIGDHNYQGFSKIKSAVAGQTVLYYKGEKYICVENVDGVKDSNGLTANHGANVRGRGVDLWLYTCNDWSGRSVRIVGWNKI